jgi:hypothetical protein
MARADQPCIPSRAAGGEFGASLEQRDRCSATGELERRAHSNRAPTDNDHVRGHMRRIANDRRGDAKLHVEQTAVQGLSRALRLLAAREAPLDKAHVRIVRTPAPSDNVPAYGLVGVGVAWPSGRGAKPSGVVCARLEDEADVVPGSEANEPLLADAALDGFDATLPQEAGKGRRGQQTPVAAARRDESEPGR